MHTQALRIMVKMLVHKLLQSWQTAYTYFSKPGQQNHKDDDVTGYRRWQNIVMEKKKKTYLLAHFSKSRQNRHKYGEAFFFVMSWHQFSFFPTGIWSQKWPAWCDLDRWPCRGGHAKDSFSCSYRVDSPLRSLRHHILPTQTEKETKR